MDTQLFYEATGRFEAARRVDILPNSHRSKRLHGHSFVVRVRSLPEGDKARFPGSDLFDLTQRVELCSEKLNYILLNDALEVPTDENLARWFLDQLSSESIRSVGIQSTTDEGADLDADSKVHVWRRFTFEAAHQLPRVPPGHKCGRMHGHGFDVVLHAEQDLPAGSSMGVDFDIIEMKWQPLLHVLNYKCLNDIPGLDNPTSELLAQWIWKHLKSELPELSWVSVYETKSSGCHFDGRHFRIWKEQTFESAIRLLSVPDYFPQHSLHGHSYMIRMHLAAPLDEVKGWTVDYGDVKEIFKPLYELVDHQRLDEIDGLDAPTLAGLLKWFKGNLIEALPQLDRLDLYERPGCGAVLCWGAQPPALPTRAV